MRTTLEGNSPSQPLAAAPAGAARLSLPESLRVGGGLGRGKMPMLPTRLTASFSDFSIDDTDFEGVNEVLILAMFTDRHRTCSGTRTLMHLELLCVKEHSFVSFGPGVSIGAHGAYGGWGACLSPGRDHGNVADAVAYTEVVIEILRSGATPPKSQGAYPAFWQSPGGNEPLDLFIATLFSGLAVLQTGGMSNAYPYLLENRHLFVVCPEYRVLQHLVLGAVYSNNEEPFRSWRGRPLPVPEIIEAYDFGVQALMTKTQGLRPAVASLVLPAGARLQLVPTPDGDDGLVGVCGRTGAFSITSLLADACRGTTVMAAVINTFEIVRNLSPAEVRLAHEAIPEPALVWDPPQWGRLTKAPGFLPGFGILPPVRSVSWTVRHFFTSMASRVGRSSEHSATPTASDWPVLTHIPPPF